MGATTKIEWCDATLNLWWGCTKVSDGCKHCYAETLSDQRYKKGAWGPNGVRQEVKGWRATLNKISKQANAEGRRLRVFCQSMSDTFEGPETCGGVDSENWRLMERLRAELFYEIPRHPELDFLLLTKRPENIERTVRECWTAANSPELLMCDNAWFGTSVEGQKTADERIPHLLRIPAKVRFLSCEPMIGTVDLVRVVTFRGAGGIRNEVDSLRGLKSSWGCGASLECWPPKEPRLHWVICGGESGPNARPMHPDWARSLRDQCVAAGVPFFFKQWGEYTPDEAANALASKPMSRLDPWEYHEWNAVRKIGIQLADHSWTFKVGKHRAGRVLDGQEWSQFPEVCDVPDDLLGGIAL